MRIEGWQRYLVTSSVAKGENGTVGFFPPVKLQVNVTANAEGKWLKLLHGKECQATPLWSGALAQSCSG